MSGFCLAKGQQEMISSAFLCTERPWASRLTAADGDDDEDDERWKGSLDERV